jgi:ubiquitin-conjugating enzyme E2 Z
MASANSDSSSTYITKETSNRLIKDITDIFKHPLDDQGIYYIHDDTNMLKGYAMIIGPEDTPYEDGFYFFKFQFPYNYPQQPPVLTYLTNDGHTRFNPNLYRTGKVCLSVLNTWRGEGWTSCQTIRSVLLTLVTVLNETPLLNEPGVKKSHADYETYQQIITYKNLRFAFTKMVSQTTIPESCIAFYPFMKKHALKCEERIMNKVSNLAYKYKTPRMLLTRLYGMRVKMDYPELLTQMGTLYSTL